MSHKIIPLRYYYVNALVLTVLMILTVVAAKVPAFHLSNNPNGLNLAVALIIAVLKAGCIVAVFMGSWWQSGLVRLLSVAGFAWLLIFFMFMATDYGNPLEEFGTPYEDSRNPGANPLPGGQNHPVTGFEHAPAHGGDYVQPPHLFGGEHEEGHGEAVHEAAPAAAEHH